MEATSAPQRRLSVGDTINETFSIYGQQFLPLIGSAIVVFVVIGIIAGLLLAAGGVILVLLATAVRLAGQALYVGFAVKLVEDVRDGRRELSISDLFSAAAPAIFRERVGVFDAFGRRRNLVRGSGWTVFGTLVVVLLIVIAIGIVLGVI